MGSGYKDLQIKLQVLNAFRKQKVQKIVLADSTLYHKWAPLNLKKTGERLLAHRSKSVNNSSG